ncbi:MAG: hypothetical protein QHH02_08980 [Syntrophomonadaceae bacterium]|nr:hypothetical protein [Syntrophomonadaceae bacterium]
MHRSAVRTAVALHPQRLKLPIEIASHIPMAPQPSTPAPGTTLRVGPGIIFPEFL